MANENYSYIKNGNLKRASYEEVAQWVSQAWKEVFSGHYKIRLFPSRKKYQKFSVKKNVIF